MSTETELPLSDEIDRLLIIIQGRREAATTDGVRAIGMARLLRDEVDRLAPFEEKATAIAVADGWTALLNDQADAHTRSDARASELIAKLTAHNRTLTVQLAAAKLREEAHARS